MKFSSKILTILCVAFLVSCGTKRKVTTTQKTPAKKETIIQEDIPEVAEKPQKEPSQNTYKDPVAAYVATYAAIAKEEMLKHGIPASITLAQGILESGAGRGDLCTRANNHFGIKCHDWNGPSVRHDDDELQECFRKYKDPHDSYRDHSLFLTGRSRYAGLFELEKDDYEGWAEGLKDAGYATDPKYPDKLISLIERYELYNYDAEVLGKRIEAPKTEVAVNNSQLEYVVKKGDTLYSISRRHGTTVDELKQNNNLRSNNLAIGQLLFIELPKE